MELSAEDSLRLNVLLANAAAIRVDEGQMTVRGLSRDGQESLIQLNPNCRADQYIRRVRELLSSVVLGSPGGYPVFLKRWTRMGQTAGARLADLLRLGEPEAVVAVCGSPELTDELAELAWWAMPDAGNARRMLAHSAVAGGSMGPVLAEFLVEFLPFEEEPRAIVESVRLLLQPGLIDETTRQAIWKRGRAKGVFRIGFLLSTPDDLPECRPPHPSLEGCRDRLEALAGADNRVAAHLLRLLEGPGQTFLEAFGGAMKRPSDQDSYVALLEAGERYHAPVQRLKAECLSAEELERAVDEVLFGDPARHPDLQQVLQEVPEQEGRLRAMMFLAHVGEPQVRLIFARTDAVGTVLRKKLEPLAGPVQRQIDVMLG